MLHWGLGRRFARWGPSSVAVDADAATLIAAMTVPPDATRQALINQTVTDLKAAGIWTKLDVFYIIAAHDAQAARLNWKSPSTFAFTATNSPVFTVDRGYKGDGTTAYLISGHNSTTFAGAHQLNSAVEGVWIQLASTINSSIDLYSVNGRTMRASTGATYQGRINDAVSINIGAGAPTTGHYAMRRTTSTERSAWLAGTSRANDAQVSGSNGTAFTLLGTGGASFSDARVAAAYAGGGFADADMAAMNTALSTWMTTVGA